MRCRRLIATQRPGGRCVAHQHTAPALPAIQSSLIRPQPPASGELPQDDLSEVVIRRGSTRQFCPRCRSTLTSSPHCSWLDPRNPRRSIPIWDFWTAWLNPVTPYLHHQSSVDGLESGAYIYGARWQALERLRSGRIQGRCAASWPWGRSWLRMPV